MAIKDPAMLTALVMEDAQAPYTAKIALSRELAKANPQKTIGPASTTKSTVANSQ